MSFHFFVPFQIIRGLLNRDARPMPMVTVTEIKLERRKKGIDWISLSSQREGSPIGSMLGGALSAPAGRGTGHSR
jgi:hypothetical protein